MALKRSDLRDEFEVLGITETESGDSAISRAETSQRFFFGKLMPLSNIKQVESKNVGDSITHRVQCHYDDVADLLDFDGSEFWLQRRTTTAREKYRIRSACELKHNRRFYEGALELIERVKL